MWFDTDEGRTFVAELTKRVISDVAPEELPLFDELLQEHFEHPEPPNHDATDSDDELGFGLGETLIAATPAAIAMVQIVLMFVSKEILSAAKDETVEVLKKQVKALFNVEEKQTVDDGPTPLTREQLEQIKKHARQQAKKFGMEPAEADKMATALVGALALSK